MVYIILVAILIALDQVSKYIIDNNFFEGDTLGAVSYTHLTLPTNSRV